MDFRIGEGWDVHALVPGRRLALSDPEVVRANLVQCGFHLQLPPTDALRAAAVQAGEIDD